MARKPQVQTRVAEDTKAQIDAYQDDHSISQSDAIRRLIRAGLAAEDYPVAAADGGDRDLLETIASARTMGIAGGLMILGGILLLAASWFAQSAMWWLALGSTVLMTLSMTTAAILSVLAALAQLALARPLGELNPLGTEEKA